jgi:dTDP-4-dehydrorhamnose reductase
MAVKRVLVVGSNGLLGQKMTELLLRGSPHTVILSSIEDKPAVQYQSIEYVGMDITARKEVRQVLTSIEPDVIVNCAAITNVDACETERELAWKVNVTGVENLIDAAQRGNSNIIHVSTDYIFDGKAGPYTEEGRPDPLSYYGKSKLASENALRVSGLPFVIARTMVLYGYAPSAKPNFVLWLIQNLEQNTGVRVVDDQSGNPTLVDDLAYGLLRAIDLGRTGVYNMAGREIVSRYEFALTAARVFGLDPALITPIKTATLNQPAPRPLKSGLITLKAEVELGYRPSTMEEGLMVLKTQLSRTGRRIGDSGPVPGKQPGRKDARNS